MCTLSVLNAATSTDCPKLLVAMNRDERRARPPSTPPGRQFAGALEALWPTDPQGGGTWLGVNAAGLVVGLLNHYPGAVLGDSMQAGGVSRGLIVPGLMSCRTLAEVRERICDNAFAAKYQPFRLMAAARGESNVLWYGFDGNNPMLEEETLPCCHSSSSWNEASVAPARLERFGREVLAEASPMMPATAARELLLRYHLTRSKTLLPEADVLMEREVSQTVSVSLIELGPEKAIFDYWPDPHGNPARSVRTSLTMQAHQRP